MEFLEVNEKKFNVRGITVILFVRRNISDKMVPPKEPE